MGHHYSISGNLASSGVVLEGALWLLRLDSVRLYKEHPLLMPEAKDMALPQLRHSWVWGACLESQLSTPLPR